MLEFNPDGTLKLSSGQIAQKEIEEKSIIIAREQLSEKPAKAQIRISFPEDLENPQKVKEFYDKIDYFEFSEVFHEFQQVNRRTFIVKVVKGSMRMYSLLNFMMMCFRSKFGQDSSFGNKNVILKGRWAYIG